MDGVNQSTTQYRTYELIDRSGSVKVCIVPERGGMVTSFSLDGEEYLYLDEQTFYDRKTNVRGGIPILFPICGTLTNGEYIWNGHRYRLSGHGFARNLPWEVFNSGTREDGAFLTLRLESTSETEKVYPFQFELIFTYILKGKRLRIEQEYRNHSDVVMPFYAGLHPYFKIGDKRRLEFDLEASLFLDYADGQIKPYTGFLDLTNDSKAKLFLNHKKNALSFTDPVLKRKVQYEYSPVFKYPVLWTEQGKEYLCVELFMAKMDAFNTREDLVLVNPHNKVEVSFALTVAKTDEKNS